MCAWLGVLQNHVDIFLQLFPFFSLKADCNVHPECHVTLSPQLVSQNSQSQGSTFFFDWRLSKCFDTNCLRRAMTPHGVQLVCWTCIQSSWKTINWHDSKLHYSKGIILGLYTVSCCDLPLGCYSWNILLIMFIDPRSLIISQILVKFFSQSRCKVFTKFERRANFAASCLSVTLCLSVCFNTQAHSSISHTKKS